MDSYHLKQSTDVQESDAVALLKAWPGPVAVKPAALEF